MKKNKTKWPLAYKRSEYVPLYSGTIHVATTHRQFNDVLKYFDLEPEEQLPNAGCALRIYGQKHGGKRYIIGLFDRSFNTLAHESAHVCFYILGERKVPIEQNESNEAFCYLLGWMVDRFKYLVK